MGLRIVDYPTDADTPRYAVWDSVVDQFIAVDATEHEVRDVFLLRELSSARLSWELGFERRKQGLGVKTWEEGLELMAEIHGEGWWETEFASWPPEVEWCLVKGLPHEHEAFIQWKGTFVCMDLVCLGCGRPIHVDAEFAYTVECVDCGAVHEMSALVGYRRTDNGSSGSDG